jgi:hypothetical protein
MENDQMNPIAEKYWQWYSPEFADVSEYPDHGTTL